MYRLLKKNKKGFSLAMVLIVMTILTAFGMGILSNSLKNLEVTNIISDSERAYYASENAAQLAINTIKNEVIHYYATMRAASSYSAYLIMYNNFFTHLQSRLIGEGSVLNTPDFITVQIDDNTIITCNMDTPTTQENGYLGTTFHIISSTTLDETPRIYNGSIDVVAAPITFQYTTAPIRTNDILILGGDVAVAREDDENTLTVYGSSRIGGGINDNTAFTSTNGATIHDLTVEDDLNWKLFYDQFDKSIINPLMPFVVNTSGGTAQELVSNDYEFYGDTTITVNVVTKNIYCDGNLTLLNIDVINSNLYATGNITIIDEDQGIQNNTVYGTNIYAEGDLYIELADIVNNTNNRRNYYSGGNMTLKMGKYVDNKDGSIAYGYFTAVGDINISSLTDRYNDSIIESRFYAGGSIIAGIYGEAIDPTIENIATSTFETVNGDIKISTAYMHSSSKIHSGRNVIIANKGISDSEVYADGYLIFDGSAFYSNNNDAYFSSNVKYCAQGDLTIEHANFINCYFYTGANLNIIMTSGNTIADSIMYAEGDVLYSNDWNGFMDTMVSTLVYTNADFYYTGRGTDLTFAGVTVSRPAGMQIMALGSIYSYEADDDEPQGYWGSYAHPDLDLLKFGESESMDLNVILNNIGLPDSVRGVLADNLYDAGFEHTLPEPIIKMPFYTEVFKNETIN